MKDKIEKAARGIKAEFDDKFEASARGGLALVERLGSRVGLWNLLTQRLPERSGEYLSGTAASQLIDGLCGGGKGIAAAEVLRQDAVTPLLMGFDH